MGYSAVIGGTKTVPLATIRGWADAKRWIDMLDVERFEVLIQLAEFAWAQDLPKLRSQILEALKKHPPKDDSVRETMAGLATELRRAKDASIFVTDGTGEDDGEEIADEWHSGDFDVEPEVPAKVRRKTSRPKPKRTPKRKR